MLAKLHGIATSGALMVICSWGLTSTASGASPQLTDGQARFQPVQSITYDFGSKFMTGYFDRQAAACVLTIMLTEKMDPEEPLGLTPARLRLILLPGQVAGLDSEEGRSLNFTCEDHAASLLVQFGERDDLVAIQNASQVTKLAQPH
jgi:hypothetical protein